MYNALTLAGVCRYAVSVLKIRAVRCNIKFTYHNINSLHDTVILEKFTSRKFQLEIIQPNNFIFEGDQRKFLWVNFSTM